MPAPLELCTVLFSAAVSACLSRGACLLGRQTPACRAWLLNEVLEELSLETVFLGPYLDDLCGSEIVTAQGSTVSSGHAGGERGLFLSIWEAGCGWRCPRGGQQHPHFSCFLSHFGYVVM